ncbi:MAG TPA: peptide chain release factor N(5)-glutamine methyltransferase [Mycobacteriales bacterium]|nr:peptide chain release factor N(5)-glutamine methyltransferase [Mycobacteriales bacterium]
MTLALNEATETLRAAGVASPEHDTRALLAHVLGCSPSELLLYRDLSPAQTERYSELIGLRADRVPLQHLTGVAGFRRLELAVGPGVFVPRPETEAMVEWVLSQLGPDSLVVDLCTGSGAIALSIVDERPDARVHAVEREADAVAWATRNCDGMPVSLHHADIDGCLPELSGQVDLVVANPPYIPDGATVEREVAEHDPAAALWGGEDGLDVVRVVIRTATRLVRPGGRLAIEHADRQGDSVPALVRRMGSWEQVADHRDLAGRARFTTAVRSAHA